MRITRWSAGSIIVLALGSASAGAGVRPLTEQSAKDAVKRGQAVKKIGDLCPRFVVEKKGMMSIRGRFEIYVDTPFCVVASNAFEAKRKYETPPEAVILPEAEQVVLVRVNPTTVAGGFMGSTAPFSMTSEGPNILTNVHKVVIRRSGEIVQPLSTALHEVEFSNAAGATGTRTGGDFAFPLSAFDSACEIVVVHDAGEAVKKLDGKDLAKLE